MGAIYRAVELLKEDIDQNNIMAYQKVYKK